jgi:hypothetical protein
MGKKHWANIAHYEPYLRDVADRMGLKDWDVILSKKPAEDGACATADCTWGRKSVTIKLAKFLHFQTPDIQRQTVVHELVHCHFAAMHNPLNEGMCDANRDWYIHAMEYGVDAIADVIAPSMPLPPKKK